MSTMMDPMLSEFRNESATTKRVLDRIPAEKLTWKPHPKSMSLGQLAMHLALIPGALSRIAALDQFDVAQANFSAPQPDDMKMVYAALNESVRHAETYLGGLTDQRAMATWSMTRGGQEVMSMPRVVMLRSILLNHWYHHRGQMSVYLRLLDVPVPVIYGRSADENPFA